MVLFFTSTAVDPPAMVYMGKDKVENEDLIKYAWPQDVWFHVDKLSSAHVYLRMPPTMTWDSIPQTLLTDCAQLVKANSIEGNKKDNLTIIYTPGSNLKKSGDMAVGQVSFHNDKQVRTPLSLDRRYRLNVVDLQVKRVHIQKRENPIVNRLNKTKVEKDVDHEQERVDRIKKENAEKRAIAAQNKKAEAEVAKARAAEKASRSYDLLFQVEEDPDAPKLTGKAIEEDFM
ncbi:cytoplasmic protein [Suillus spraguei]|nr:cytoplasmic protein [Suillus spraguei]